MPEMQTKASRYGVLLLNMGGPRNLQEVEQYIYRLLSDPDAVRLPAGRLLQKPLARMIARLRAPKVRRRYELIGGKSPINEATAAQAAATQTELGLPVEHAMRYTRPAAGDALNSLAAREVERTVVIPLYPQYSTVSTLSAMKDLQRCNGHAMAYRTVERHYDNPGYLGAMKAELRATLQQIDSVLRTHVLFTAHSIPEAYIQRGDTYASEVERTAALVAAGEPGIQTWSLAYQSSVGPVRWRGPSLEEELQRLLSTGVEHLVVQPLSFVSENLETLYDLDIVFRQACVESGIKSFHRVRAPGSSELYIKALAGMARRVIGEWEGGNA